jgi:hypothetical protein
MTQAKPVLDPRMLTMGDMRRAREALKDHPILKDEDGEPRDVGDLLNSGDFVLVTTLCILCHRLKSDSGFTWEQAEDVPIGDYESRREDQLESKDPPPTPPSDLSGRSEIGPAERGATRRRPKREPEPSSAGSSG